MFRRLTRTAAALVLAATAAAGLAGCGDPAPPQPSQESTTTATEPEETTTTAVVDDHGVLTAAAVTEVAPGWGGSTFDGDIQALPGYDYGGDCQDSAWEVLDLLEAATAVSTTFSATSGTPAPTLTIGVLEQGAADREDGLQALELQVTECVGEGPEGEVLQEAAPAVGDWIGIHVPAEDRDVYWAPYEDGIAIVQVSPSVSELGESLRHEVEAILARQLEVLS